MECVTSVKYFALRAVDKNCLWSARKRKKKHQGRALTFRLPHTRAARLSAGFGGTVTSSAQTSSIRRLMYRHGHRLPDILPFKCRCCFSVTLATVTYSQAFMDYRKPWALSHLIH